MQVPLEVANLRASRDVAVLDFSYTFGTTPVILLYFYAIIIFLTAYAIIFFT